MIKKMLTSALIIVFTVSFMTVSTYSAFVSTAKVSGVSFATGRAELKLFGNLGYTHAGNNGNLTPVLPGFTMEGIGPNWSHDFPLKYFNTGTVLLDTSLRAEIDSDEASLADDILLEVFLWDDVNGNGLIDEGVDGISPIGSSQTIAALVASPVALGELAPGNPRGLILTFSTGDLPADTQNKLLDVDFLLDGTTAGTTP